MLILCKHKLRLTAYGKEGGMSRKDGALEKEQKRMEGKLTLPFLYSSKCVLVLNLNTQITKLITMTEKKKKP